MLKKFRINRPRSAQSLATTLAISLFALSALVLLISSALQIGLNIQSQQAALSSRQQVIAQEASKTVSNYILEKFSELDTAVKFSSPLTATIVSQKNIMEGLLGLDPAFQQFALFNSRGTQVAKVSRVSSTLSHQFISLWNGDILTQTSKDQQFISPVYFDDATSEPLISIAIPVKDNVGDFQGTLIAEVDLKFMWDLVDQLKVGKSGYAYVVDNQGNLIAFHDTSRVLQGENVKKVGEVSEFVNNPGQTADKTPGITSYTGLLGTTVVGTYVSLGTPQWAIVTELPWQEAYQEVIKNLWITVVIVLVMALLAGLVGVFLARRLSVPLVNLTETATRIAGGEMELQTAVSGPLEVVSLSSAFNHMTSQLRDLIGTLEQRVADRTKALTTSAEVSRSLSRILDQKQLVAEVVEMVKNAFGYYHAHIYLIDEVSGDLVMTGGTGEAGKIMLANDHRIQKGKGLVGRAAETKQIVLVADTSKDPTWLPNKLLPETKSELAVPILAGEQVLGVLDVQHNITDGLGPQDAEVIGAIANQVTVALQNIRLYLETVRFKLGIERSGDAVFATDPKGTIIYANPAFEKVYGYTPVEVIGKNPRIIKSGLISMEKYQEFWGALLSKNNVTGEIVNKHKDGHLVYIAGTNSAIVDDSGDILGFLAVHHDVSETKKADEATKHTTELLSEALDIAKLANWEYDVEKDRFHFNDHFYSIFHTTAEQMGGYEISSAQYAQHLVHPDDVPVVGAAIEKALASKDQHYSTQLEHRILYSDGGIGFISVVIHIDRDDQGRIIRYYGANQDITESKLAYEAVQHTTELLSEALDIAKLANWEYDVEKDLFHFNDHFYSIFHTTADQVGGYEISSAQYAQHLVHPDDLPVVGAAIEKAVASKDRHYSTQLEHRIVYSDGGIGYISVVIHIDRDDQGRIIRYYGANQDITERKQAEEALKKRATELELAAHVSSAAATILETDQLLQEVVDLTKRTFNLYHAHIYLLDESGDTLELTAGAGEVGKQMVAERRNIPLNREQSLVAQAARNRQGVIVNNVRSEPNFLPHPLLPETRAELAVPMIAGNRVVGVFDIQSDKVDHFTEDDIRIQTTLASQVAVAVQNTRSFSQAQYQAKRETALNVINQKIQSATTVEAVLQIAARELGYALGAPLTIAQLGIKDRNNGGGQ